jgi:DNA-binding PucR family transcriptional regulator
MAIAHEGLDAVAQQHLASVLAGLSPLELGEEMADLLIESIPEFGRSTDTDFREGAVLSCQSNVTALWELLNRGAPTDQISPPHGAIAWAHELVHRGMELAALLRAYRLGHGLVERRFEEVASDLEIPPDVRWRVSAHATRYFFVYVDSVCTKLVQDYEQERARWIRGAAAARAEVVTAIIEGAAVDAGAATTTLRYDVNRRHLGFIVWADADAASGGGAGGSASLEAAASALAAELGGGTPLTVQIGERIVWAWTHWPAGEETAVRRAAALRDGQRAALGTPAIGLDGMRRSHEEARAARRVAELLGLRAGSVAHYRTAALTALLTADPAEAVRFAEAQLGDLAQQDDGMARLRATVRVYLEEHLSPARTARRLGIHQNTVVYRIKRAEEVLGRTLAESGLELAVALRLSEGLESLRTAAVGQH